MSETDGTVTARRGMCGVCVPSLRLCLSYNLCQKQNLASFAKRSRVTALRNFFNATPENKKRIEGEPYSQSSAS